MQPQPSSGFNSQSEFTLSEHQSDLPADSSFDLTYTSMKMANDKQNKRRKRGDSMDELSGVLNDFDRSHELEKDLRDDFDDRYEQL